MTAVRTVPTRAVEAPPCTEQDTGGGRERRRAANMRTTRRRRRRQDGRTGGDTLTKCRNKRDTDTSEASAEAGDDGSKHATGCASDPHDGADPIGTRTRETPTPEARTPLKEPAAKRATGCTSGRQTAERSARAGRRTSITGGHSAGTVGTPVQLILERQKIRDVDRRVGEHAIAGTHALRLNPNTQRHTAGEHLHPALPQSRCLCTESDPPAAELKTGRTELGHKPAPAEERRPETRRTGRPTPNRTRPRKAEEACTDHARPYPNPRDTGSPRAQKIGAVLGRGSRVEIDTDAHGITPAATGLTGRMRDTKQQVRISLMWITDSGDVDYRSRRGGAPVGA